MSRGPEPIAAHFEPLYPASRTRMVAAFVLGPLIWLVALVVGLLLVHRADVIEVGLLITFAAFVVSCAGLLAFYVARRRQELREHRR